MASTWRNRLRALIGDKKTLTVVSARAPMIVSGVLGFAVVVQAVVIALSLSAEASAGLGASTTRTTSARIRAQSGTELQKITAAHLFGSAPLTMTSANTRAASRSPLVLTGTIATSDPRVGYAILGSSATSTRTVYTGTEAAPGTVLAEVYPQWVVLLHGGERVTLRLPRSDPQGNAGGVVDRALARAQSAPVEGDGDSATGAVPARPSPPQFSDGAAVLRAFALRRTTVDGQQGEQIGNTSLNHKVLGALNLSPGDVITQINGVPVGAHDSPDLMSALQSGSATLMVVKDGQETSVTLDSSSMADAAALFRQADPDL